MYYILLSILVVSVFLSIFINSNIIYLTKEMQKFYGYLIPCLY